ncbi:MAG: hypothetical protein RLO46_01315, partial [Pseudomonadales bacterium]
MVGQGRAAWGLSLSLAFGLLAGGHAAAAPRDEVLAQVAAERDAAVAMAQDLWSLAELGYQETRSSERLQRYLAERGFQVQSGAAGMPTAFVASFGSGRPVIGLLAEFDALPGLSQAAVPHRQALVERGAGHACGHHLFGAAADAAGAAVSACMAESGQPGTVRVY